MSTGPISSKFVTLIHDLQMSYVLDILVPYMLDLPVPYMLDLLVPYMLDLVVPYMLDATMPYVGPTSALYVGPTIILSQCTFSAPFLPFTGHNRPYRQKTETSLSLGYLRDENHQTPTWQPPSQHPLPSWDIII